MNPRLAAILELARRYDYDAEHAHQVECLAGTLFMEMEPLHNLGREDRKLLEYAAILHDIGYYVTSQGHHRHALQMILTEPLPEFTREEKQVIANVARYHRKALPMLEHTSFAVLSPENKQRVGWLAPLLRVADALDHSHRGLVKELTCDIREQVVTIRVGAETELPEETQAMARKADMFRHVYRREVVLDVLRPRLPNVRAEPDYEFEGAC